MDADRNQPKTAAAKAVRYVVYIFCPVGCCSVCTGQSGAVSPGMAPETAAWWSKQYGGGYVQLRSQRRNAMGFYDVLASAGRQEP